MDFPETYCLCVVQVHNQQAPDLCVDLLQQKLETSLCNFRRSPPRHKLSNFQQRLRALAYSHVLCRPGARATDDEIKYPLPLRSGKIVKKLDVDFVSSWCVAGYAERSVISSSCKGKPKRRYEWLAETIGSLMPRICNIGENMEAFKQFHSLILFTKKSNGQRAVCCPLEQALTACSPASPRHRGD